MMIMLCGQKRKGRSRLKFSSVGQPQREGVEEDEKRRCSILFASSTLAPVDQSADLGEGRNSTTGYSGRKTGISRTKDT